MGYGHDDESSEKFNGIWNNVSRQTIEFEINKLVRSILEQIGDKEDESKTGNCIIVKHLLSQILGE